MTPSSAVAGTSSGCLARGLTATAIARVTGYSAYWIGQIARRYNTAGPDGVRDQRRPGRARHPLLTEEHQAALRAALAEPHPAGDHWCGRTVAAWMSAHLGRRVSRQAAWRALRRLGARFLKPRPRHVQADPRGAGLLQGASAPAAARGGHGLPARHRRAVGSRRTSHWAQADPAARSGVSTGSVPSLRCSIATSGATSWASSIPPRAARSFIWPPR